MNTLKIATIQSDLVWEDIHANLHRFETKIAAITEPIDLVVLPEMFTTGFSMNINLADKPDGVAMQWMRKMAKTYQTAICGSVMIRAEDGHVYNRMVWMNTDGNFHTYDKHHLFSIGSENNHFKPGQQKVIIPFKGFDIQLLICYDLRFPVWVRRTLQENFDAIVIVANWPEKRAEHWRALLKARAIENQCYVIAVNRVGQDGHLINHKGDSCLITPTGLVTYEKSFEEETSIHTLDIELVNQYRKEFPVINDADDFKLL
jgi:omega-amidase